MKINWGTSIAIFYICFMAIMISMVVKSSRNNVHLVQENYYTKDLNYESFRQKRQNATNLNEQIKVEYFSKAGNLIVTFPKNMSNVAGSIELFRPSNKNLDQSFPISIDKNGEMVILFEKSLKPGLWKVHVDWETNNVPYFSEESIVI